MNRPEPLFQWAFRSPPDPFGNKNYFFVQNCCIIGTAVFVSDSVFKLCEQLPDKLFFCSADGKTLLVYPGANSDAYTVPKGVTTIGYEAFSGNNLKSVTLPEGLKEIGQKAFSGCTELSSVTFPSTLEEIGEGAFERRELTEIALNDGLKTISNRAFYGTKSYTSLTIPDSVTTIEMDAFRGNHYADTNELTPVETRTVAIGSGLENLGQGAFAGLDIDSFTVAPQNEHFKADGPLLLSKDGRTLYACAGAAGPEVHIPDGVEEILPSAFDAVPALTDIYLPNSLYRMSSASFDSSKAKTITFHCPSGSEAALIAETQGYTWVEE